jgi:lipopolysaccharide transport system permease protein
MMGVKVRQLIAYRDLVRNLVLRDLKVRYKNSVLGFFWSLLNPLLMMIILTIVFGILIQIADIQRFPLFILTGLLPWNYLAVSLLVSTSSIVNSAPLIKKVYFPREVLPLSAVLSELVHFLLALVVLFALFPLFGVGLTRWVLVLPLLMLIESIFIIGLALFLSTLNVFYRDTQSIMGVATNAWFFLTPVIYPLSTLPQNYQLRGLTMNVQSLVMTLNPMAALVTCYRSVILEGAPPAFDLWFRSLIMAVLSLLVGYLVFNRHSRLFGEVL